MSYATAQDLIDRFGETELAELTDRVNGAVIDVTVIGRALADADAEINGYLVSRYTLPLAITSPILTKFAGDIARYQLYDTRASEQVTARYNDAIKFMKSLASGLVSLGIDSVGEPVASAGGAQVASAGRVFSRSDRD